ncbi:26271_t:CDS:1, partial [Gigaspora rosea]
IWMGSNTEISKVMYFFIATMLGIYYRTSEPTLARAEINFLNNTVF